ncbi:hypothetical protein F7725_014589 [Dissostichus mawsoni]|uniref:glucose-6-phosphatase n=1 Tax=Dissostichus mawsoni TaxID=36200 RepID=A0A7J5YYL4_DISMA|nr:hypothetical protein F7725_014589 [Dissostichus mawsoni]
MDLLHSWGVELVVHLQTTHSRHEGLFSLASTVADLHTTFFCFFAIWFHLRRDTGIRLIWVAVLGDWVNMVLKWVLFGERPYWWVHETRFYGAGPVGLWMLMLLVVLVVCMSRVYMATHFPHQVVAGVLTGVLLAEVVSKEKWIYSASMKKYFYTTLFLSSFAVGFNLLLTAVAVGWMDMCL